MTLTAHIPTANASRYLQQLCKHWSHKFETEFDPQSGIIAFPMGPIRMAAQDDALVVTIDPTPDADVAAFFDNLDPAAGDVLVATGWALAEDLEKLA